MPDTVIEADIEHGKIIPKHPEMLPETGKALITIVESGPKKPDWDVVMSLLGKMENKMDGLAFEREVRAGWAERERKQWQRKQ